MSEPLALTLPDALVDQVAERVLAILAEREATVPAAWLDVTAAARHLGYADNVERGRRRVYDLTSRGELTPRRDGSRLLFRPADLDRYLEGQK